jgi:hypothetical protein
VARRQVLLACKTGDPFARPPRVWCSPAASPPGDPTRRAMRMCDRVPQSGREANAVRSPLGHFELIEHCAGGENRALSTVARRHRVTRFVSGDQSQDNQALGATIARSSVWTRWFSAARRAGHAMRMALRRPRLPSLARARSPRHAGVRRHGLGFTWGASEVYFLAIDWGTVARSAATRNRGSGGATTRASAPAR